MDVFQREERCRKVIKNVRKAIVIRLVVVALVIFAFTRTAMSPWLVGLMLLVVVITLGALPPLLKELKARRAELKTLMESEE
ncbi:MAG: hypothetical protein SPD81_10880 [Candidatus Faecousia sp.]|nr:hypothetical protein [Candidatus Faecousia sp.]